MLLKRVFHADNLRAFESIFSLGNGRLGQRGNFEETYSSDTLQGSYLAGISYLDKTRVGWWKTDIPTISPVYRMRPIGQHYCEIN